MHILLTGSTGFIGNTLQTALQRAGHTVHGGVSPRSRTLLQATYGDGDGRTAAGARVGLGEQGVKSSLRRLRAFLHDCIRQRLEVR